jgi:hypothetical protein
MSVRKPVVTPRPPDPFLLLCTLLVELEAEGTPDDPAVVQARIDLYRHLVEEGWQPPERIRSLLHLNDLVLALDVEQWLASAAEQAPDVERLVLPSPAAPPRSRAPQPAAEDPVLLAAYARGPQADVREVDPLADRLVTEAEEDLRLVTRPLDATRRLVALVQELGGDLASTTGPDPDLQDPDVLPLDLSFAAGPPLLVRAEPLSLARLRLERHLPGLVEVARRALAEAAR